MMLKIIEIGQLLYITTIPYTLFSDMRLLLEPRLKSSLRREIRYYTHVRVLKVQKK